MTSRDLSKKYKVGNFFSTFFVAHVLIFFHFSTRFPHSLFKNFLRKIFKRAQTMLQSWLKFTGSFSFHFSKLPRQNFLQKFCHPFKEGEFFTFSTLKTIDARFARAKKHLQNLSLPDFRDKLYGAQPQNALFFYKPFIPTEHFFENCFIIKLFSPKFKFYPIFSKFNK